MLTVKCPKCLHDMCYQPLCTTPKSKRCVYCGSTFKVHSDLAKSRIVCVGKRVEFNMPMC